VNVRTVAILGATGSVGRSTLDLLERHADRFDVVAVTANRDVAGLADAARRVRARRAVIADAGRFQELRDALAGSDIEAAAGEDALVEAASSGADWTMAAIVGTAGLRSVMAAIRRGGMLALANKEALVSAGSVMMRAAQESGATILPVDSEHNAVFQCLDRAGLEAVARIILTASGGPFLRKSLDEMRLATPEQAVAHPNWSMGAKISVDSATLMNKGLELIEAHHLFGVAEKMLDVIVHPQSIVHSLVEYRDGSVLAQLGPADMRVPIAHALAWPERIDAPPRLDLLAVGTLQFEKPDTDRFPALRLAHEAMRSGGATPAVLNAANEVAVASFLDKRIGFLDIVAVTSELLEKFDAPAPYSLDEVFDVDRQARERAAAIVERYVR
jgi:1-deoxy-D-xylulose-5-phosphate reductoisomerase